MRHSRTVALLLMGNRFFMCLFRVHWNQSFYAKLPHSIRLFIEKMSDSLGRVFLWSIFHFPHFVCTYFYPVHTSHVKQIRETSNAVKFYGWYSKMRWHSSYMAENLLHRFRTWTADPLHLEVTLIWAKNCHFIKCSSLHTERICWRFEGDGSDDWFRWAWNANLQSLRVSWICQIFYSSGK